MIFKRDRGDLSQPRQSPGLGAHYDPDAFGQLTETAARFLGTGRYLVIQTCLVFLWILLNTWAVTHHWDPYPFILLNLMFSTQAAYAAPLILLAQNRQDERDRQETERDREVNARTQADTEYVARELASMRLAMSDVVTSDDLKDAVERVTDVLAQLTERLDATVPPADPDDGGAPSLTDP